jgi:hypothetical protein
MRLLTYSGSTNTQISANTVGFCPGETAFDCKKRRFWVGAQCGAGNDPVFVFDADGIPVGIESALAMTESVLRELGAVPEQVDRERARVRADLTGHLLDLGPSYTGRERTGEKNGR